MKSFYNKDGKVGLTAYSLKTIGIIAMSIDHIAWAFIPTGSVLGQVMHFIGRLTAPIMSFFIAEGYHYTKNIKRYVTRLALFALISHIPYYYFNYGTLPKGLMFYPTSVIYTLLLGLISLIIWNSEKFTQRQKEVLVIGICVMATVGDWAFFTVLWVFVFGVNRGNPKMQIQGFCIVGIFFISVIVMEIVAGNIKEWYGHIFQIGIFAVIPLLRKYNGQAGGNKISKWFFYIFYPIHLLILGLLKFDIVSNF